MKLKSNIMEKPYNRCLYCSYRLSKKCDGPRTSGMKTVRWREYMRDIKEVEQLTFKDISERTGNMISPEGVQNVLAPGNTRDVNRETARLIENAIFGSSNTHPCPVDIMGAIPEETKKILAVEEEMEGLRKNIALIHDSYKQELSTVREEAQAKIDHLKEQIEYLRKVNEQNAKIIEQQSNMIHKLL